MTHVNSLSFPILDGPSLMELMLAHYDPKPLGPDGDYREVAFKLPIEANESHIKADEVMVRILGTRHKKVEDPVWTFQGFFHDYRDGTSRSVGGRFNVGTRKGRIRFGEVEERIRRSW